MLLKTRESIVNRTMDKFKGLQFFACKYNGLKDSIKSQKNSLTLKTQKCPIIHIYEIDFLFAYDISRKISVQRLVLIIAVSDMGILMNVLHSSAIPNLNACKPLIPTLNLSNYLIICLTMIDLMFLSKLPKAPITEDNKIIKYIQKEGTEPIPKNSRIYFSYKQYDCRGEQLKSHNGLLFREN